MDKARPHDAILDNSLVCESAFVMYIVLRWCVIERRWNYGDDVESCTFRTISVRDSLMLY